MLHVTIDKIKINVRYSILLFESHNIASVVTNHSTNTLITLIVIIVTIFVGDS